MKQSFNPVRKTYLLDLEIAQVNGFSNGDKQRIVGKDGETDSLIRQPVFLSNSK
jgi:hypothetical protein